MTGDDAAIAIEVIARRSPHTPRVAGDAIGVILPAHRMGDVWARSAGAKREGEYEGDELPP